MVQTSKGILKTRIIVGADGANSRVSRAIGLPVHSDRMFAIEAEIDPGEVQPRHIGLIGAAVDVDDLLECCLGRHNVTTGDR